MRLGTLVAIARRDLRMELRGARGLLFGALTAGLLLPASAVPVTRPENLGPAPTPQQVRVSGELPEDVGEAVVLAEGSPTRIARDDDGRYVVRGPVPGRLRKAFDAVDPEPVRIEVIRDPLPVPGRTLLMALISSSIMMGALSESLAGERARRTLSTLLAAAVTKEEIVVGKWLAWTGYGATAALLSAGVAIASGQVEPGLWLLPLPVVPAATVALGLYLVRRARDVVAGATISLRVLPAALMGAGIAAWFLGRVHPLAGASVPLGGALLTAGNTWPGVAPPLVATAVTGACAAALLQRTAHDLSDDPGGEVHRSPMRDLVFVGAMAATAWLAPILGPLLWGMAGNPNLTEGLDPQDGAVAGGASLVLLAGLRVARDGLTTAQLRKPTLGALPLGLGAVGALAGALAIGLTWEPMSPNLAAAQARLTAAAHPSTVVGLLAVAAGQEVVFRGILQRSVGPWLALAAFVAVITPQDPLHGLAVGLPLAMVTAHSNSVWPAIALRIAALAASLLVTGIPAAVALAAALVAAAALAWTRPSR
ncbi:MAG: hypothetical protein EP330_20705 [Deltaproteobacteria bacterium]|nr:MAG: hypothetical protein EP330_20705 [Deltaproteobacteria bacterium]